LKDWFSTKLIVILSPGWLASKDVTRFCTAVLAGLGPVVTSHMVAVAPLAVPVAVDVLLALLLLLLLELPLLHAATAVAVATASVTAASARLLRMMGHLLKGVAADISESFLNNFDVPTS
jgi:hypothetical protein